MAVTCACATQIMALTTVSRTCSLETSVCGLSVIINLKLIQIVGSLVTYREADPL